MVFESQDISYRIHPSSCQGECMYMYIASMPPSTRKQNSSIDIIQTSLIHSSPPSRHPYPHRHFPLFCPHLYPPAHSAPALPARRRPRRRLRGRLDRPPKYRTTLGCHRACAPDCSGCSRACWRFVRLWLFGVLKPGNVLVMEVVGTRVGGMLSMVSKWLGGRAVPSGRVRRRSKAQCVCVCVCE
jgi:hypothetical protein